MTGQQRYSQGAVITALQETRGLTTLAARRLGCSRGTVENYAARYPAVRIALDDARARQLDVAEAQLFKAIDEGNLAAIMFYLRTLGRRRGYGDRVEVDATVDVLQAPEWLRTRALLLDVLGAYPEARTAVVRRLRALESSQDAETGDAEAAG